MSTEQHGQACRDIHLAVGQIFIGIKKGNNDPVLFPFVRTNIQLSEHFLADLKIISGLMDRE